MLLPSERRIIIVATNKELSCEHYYRRLWIVMRNLSDEFSRRQLVDVCIGYYRDMNGKLDFKWPGGIPYILPDWDIWFSDPDGRWLSYFLEQCNGLPKRRSHLYSRLRVCFLLKTFLSWSPSSTEKPPNATATFITSS